MQIGKIDPEVCLFVSFLTNFKELYNSSRIAGMTINLFLIKLKSELLNFFKFLY